MNSGYLVCKKDMNADAQEATYQGFAKYDLWPLACCKDSISVALSKEFYARWFSHPMDSFGRYSLMLLDDLNYIVRYCAHCRSLSIEYQVFFVEDSEAQSVIALQESSLFEFIGWDYIASVDASYLFDDGNYVMEKYAPYADLLNENGLFTTLENAKQYAMIRKQALLNGEDIELLGDEFFVRVFKDRGRYEATEKEGILSDIISK